MTLTFARLAGAVPYPCHCLFYAAFSRASEGLRLWMGKSTKGIYDFHGVSENHVGLSGAL